uniref:Putative guanylate-kinase-associated protein n=1 Tax=Culex tarsalis TaxID=7177 RepID=A0A1Q3EZK9_CULTA
MEYRAFYKNASRGQSGRLKDSNSQAVRSKRESSRQDLHFTNRNLNTSDLEDDNENADDAPLFRKTPRIKIHPPSEGKKRRRSHREDEEDKENVMRTKYEERLARLRKYKEEKAKAKLNSAKKPKPFVSVVPKNNLVDREYEKNLFKKSEQELKKMAEKRKLITPAAKHVTPRVDTRRREPLGNAEQDRARRNILNVKTPASVKLAQPKVDTWRRGATPSNEVKLQKINSATVTKSRTATKMTTTTTKGAGRNKLPTVAAPTSATTKTAAAAASSKKGGTAKIIAGATGFTTYQKVRSGQKSTQFNFKFINDGQMVTSTNRKKKSLEKLFRANAPQHLQITHFSPKAHPPAQGGEDDDDDDDIFAGISPIDVDTPTPKKQVLDTEQLAIVKREIRRRSMVFKVEDVKQEVVVKAEDEWEPQVITISDDSDCGPQMSGSFTVKEVKKEDAGLEVDRRPTIVDSPRLIGSGRKSLTGRPSLIFVEQDNDPAAEALPLEAIANPDATQIFSGQDSLVFVEEDQLPEEEEEPAKVVVVPTIEVFDSPKRSGAMGSPSRRLSGTPRMSFVEEDVVVGGKPLPESNLATLLLNKQDGKRRSSGGSRRTSLNSFREEDQPPSDVREKVLFYYNLVDKELKRLQELCDLYKDDAEDETIDENSKGLIIAAQGQTNILINKKLSKFKELVGHYERSWADQKVRTDDLDGFWLMVSLDLENLDRRFEELRVLKDNNWQEVVEQPKVKKIAGGGGIKKRDKKPMKTKASGLADLIKKAREEAKRKKMMEVALTETVTVVTPVKRSVRIATTPRRSSLARNSICTGCTPTAVPSGGKKSRKTIFNDHTLRRQEIVKSILKTPSEKRRAKSVLFLDSGLDTPEFRRSNGGRKIVHTPKPKITFNEELEVEEVETISLTTPYKLDEEIRKRRRSSLFVPVPPAEEEKEETQGCCSGSSRRKTLRFDAEEPQDEAQDQITSPVAFDQAKKEKSKRTTRGKSRGKVSFL